MKHSRPSARVVQAVAAAAVFTGVTALMCISLCSADDFWYSTFLDGGVAQFLELSRYHYEVFNGRVLVHLAAQVILHFGRWCFALFGLLCCLAIPLAALKAAQRPRGQVPACLALFGAGVLALPRALLVEGLLWTSAFCNYALPTAMIVGELLLLMRAARGEKTRPGLLFACLLAGFLCGATTEQSGFAAMAAAGLVGLLCLAKNRRRLAYPAAALLGSAAGLLTVFLSPATYGRFFRETKAAALDSFFESLCAGLDAQSAMFGAGHGASLLLSLLFVLAALAVMHESGKRGEPLAAAVLSASAALLQPFLSGGVQIACYALLLFCLLFWAVALATYSRHTEGFLLLLALVCVAVMLPTKSVSARVFLPAFLYALAAGALLLSQQLSQAKPVLQAALPLAAVLGAFFFRLPFFSGCWANCLTEAKNAEAVRQARDTGVLYYCLDYDMSCTYSRPFSDGFFYNTYLQSVGLSADIPSFFYGEGKPLVYVNGRRITSPALPDGEGGWMLPLRDIVEPMGADIEITDMGLVVRLPGRDIDITYLVKDEAQVTWRDAGGDLQTIAVPKPESYFETLLGQRIYTEVFGLAVRMSPDGTRIDVTVPSP